MSDTTLLQLPLLAAAQAQKHVTHNEALLKLDALVQMATISRTETEPPGSPNDGDRYIPASGATGAWTDWDWNVAWYVDGVWTKLVPRAGWRVWVEDEARLLVWDGAAWAGTGREMLAAARDYYVNGTTGWDGHDGLTPDTAFATVQAAIDAAASLDSAIHEVTINVAAGTYASVQGNVCKNMAGAGAVTIVGDEGAPGNVLITTSGVTPAGFHAAGVRTLYRVRGVELRSTGSATPIGLWAANGGRIEFRNVIFGSGLGQQIRAADFGAIAAAGNYTIAAGALQHINCTQGQVRVQSRTVTLAGTPNFTGTFLFCNTLGLAFVNGNTFSGSATGKRYDVALNAVVNTGGGGATYLPGDASGTVATGGQYA